MINLFSHLRPHAFCLSALALTLGACAPAAGGDESVARGAQEATPGACEVNGAAPDFLKRIACKADFDALASIPIDANIPGARSVKVVLDLLDGDALYFQNSQKYQIHYQFASKFLSGNGKPVVPTLSSFNQTEYYSPERRFILGSVTYYEDPKLFTFELAPYDTASAEMIELVVDALRAPAYFGPELVFHPTSGALEVQAKSLPADVKVVTTDELFANIEYQPLTLGQSVGRLHFVQADQLETEYLSPRDIVVLDKVPNDITVVSGLITEEFQTPLSHVNVLSQNRKTPNMGLRKATTNAKLRALDGKWVELTVRATEWTLREVTSAEADAYWEKKRPTPVVLPQYDVSVTGLHDVQKVVDESQGTLREAIKRSVLAHGGKSAQYGVLKNTPSLPMKPAFSIPIFYYDQFMRTNGFIDRVKTLLADPAFKDDPKVRDASLKALRKDMEKAPVDPAFQDLLRAKMAEPLFAGKNMRFRSSTNSEDLEGFPCAGCYESHTGNFDDWEDVLDAVRETWSTVWLFRTFEERAYYGIDHLSVGMGLLVHQNYSEEEANGVALTANPFDASGLEPGFYVNVQFGGDAEVVHPPPGVTNDEFLYFFSAPNRPITFLTHSTLVPKGATVLTTRQTYSLGQALQAIHDRFSAAYGPKAGNNGYYAMDVEFKFDDEGSADGSVQLFIKQARPHPGRGASISVTD
ncbi:MAG: PEP/pyruvate-binding domain-containing protein [Polyangiales bacterium]